MKADQAIPEHLTSNNPTEFCVERKKWGRGYRYFIDGEPIEDESFLDQLNSIAVPDTWDEVLLCSSLNNYILAKGNDGSGNLQYLYHDDYLEYRNLQKFNELIDFGLALPKIRRRVHKDLKRKNWDEIKLQALIVKILDKHYMRIGSRVYARKNGSYGLTTLRKKHLKEKDDHIEISYVGKSGQDRRVKLTDPDLTSYIDEVSDFSGWELFSFNNGADKVRADAESTNSYIQDISGGEFSARNFRTWAGTVLCVANQPKASMVIEQKPQRKLEAALVELVAEKLGNTPAICKEYYIHPKVLKVAANEKFDPQPCDETFMKNTLYRKYECRTMELLQRFER